MLSTYILIFIYKYIIYILKTKERFQYIIYILKTVRYFNIYIIYIETSPPASEALLFYIDIKKLESPPRFPHNQIHMSMYLMRVTQLGGTTASITYVYVVDVGTKLFKNKFFKSMPPSPFLFFIHTNPSTTSDKKKMGGGGPCFWGGWGPTPHQIHMSM